NEANVRFCLQLLGRSTGCHHAMESRNRAAGDGYEQQWEHAWGAGGDILAQRRGNDVWAREKERCVKNAKANKQLQAIDVVTWLEQHPHRKQRSEESVDEQDDDPDTSCWNTHDGVWKRDRVFIADEHQRVQGN